jgi:hypothetical protein
VRVTLSVALAVLTPIERRRRRCRPNHGVQMDEWLGIVHGGWHSTAAQMTIETPR